MQKMKKDSIYINLQKHNVHIPIYTVNFSEQIATMLT